ncbi:uncharacterized protein B0J16DRAFT_350309 [Fusarium flagelliforme]|uniref:uncharacterized protein n=1 Tax=Fusarium flagelliforme TaxID=2675880 RepID=UPI001E8E692A|nr:uncharacterized protein B0J16DRAFT_350309 [Fusarium flagelliforme]KAH7173516.1 hypothetical protein B0J16DRAFT_350309 [Fusarium flagelliforme]
MSLVDVARIMSDLDLPFKTLPELETSSEIANASLEATLDKESTRPAERVKNHMMEIQKIRHLPQPLYSHVGPIVVLLMRLERPDETRSG